MTTTMKTGVRMWINRDDDDHSEYRGEDMDTGVIDECNEDRGKDVVIGGDDDHNEDRGEDVNKQGR